MNLFALIPMIFEDLYLKIWILYVEYITNAEITLEI